MASFFAKSRAFPPSQMLARNSSGVNFCWLLKALRAREEPRVSRVGRAIFSERLARGGDINTPRSQEIITLPHSLSRCTLNFRGAQPPSFPRLRLGHHDRRNFLLLHQV